MATSAAPGHRNLGRVPRRPPMPVPPAGRDCVVRPFRPPPMAQDRAFHLIRLDAVSTIGTPCADAAMDLLGPVGMLITTRHGNTIVHDHSFSHVWVPHLTRRSISGVRTGRSCSHDALLTLPSAPTIVARMTVSADPIPDTGAKASNSLGHRPSFLQAILPRDAVAVDTASHDVRASLHPPERALLTGREVEKRRKEFALGRACASAALALLGAPSVSPVLRAENGSPLWPAGYVGSITHCDGLAAAAVAEATELQSIGIDVEPAVPLPGDLLFSISSAFERRGLAGLRGTHPSPGRLLFSAKEAVYKAWYPITGRWLGFEDAEILFDTDAGGFSARILVPAAPPPFDDEVRGSFRIHAGFIATSIALACS